MVKMIISILLAAAAINAQSFSITISRDDLAGDAEGLVQYTRFGSTENIRGNISRGSSDGNITVSRDRHTADQIFRVKDAAGTSVSIWLVNSVIDETFADEEDMTMLAASGASAVIKNETTGEVYLVTVPAAAEGLAFRAGTIIGGKFSADPRMFTQLRMYEITVVDALTGEPLPDVEVEFSSGRAGDEFDLGLTDLTGMYSRQLDYGEYEVRLSKPGYIASHQNFTVDLTDLPVTLTTAMSPMTREYRIVLTWGRQPADLDAHLAGPDPAGSRFHIWWDHKVPVGGRNFLDRDDTSSYGPETITIYRPAKGEYRYAVHDYTHRGRSGTRALSYSGARVDIYGGGELIRSFDVEPGIAGNTWEVFKLTTGNEIVPLNTFRDESDSRAVIR
ncbi:MAG: hypothetical protein GXO91_04460 [FCB group bacterium]|nr:hypothetical protein [FCB group bacterium]